MPSHVICGPLSVTAIGKALPTSVNLPAVAVTGTRSSDATAPAAVVAVSPPGTFTQTAVPGVSARSTKFPLPSAQPGFVLSVAST